MDVMSSGPKRKRIINTVIGAKVKSQHLYLFVSVGGCILAVITMGIYSLLLFTSTFVFILLVCSVDPTCVHAWVFGIQMLWQTFWHLLIQYREYYLQEPVSISSVLFDAVSMDLQEKQVLLTFKVLTIRKACVMLLPLISYSLNFTTMLGGPLCSYSQFLTLMAGISLKPSPNPLIVVFLKLMQVLLLEWVRYCLVHFLKHNTYDPSNSINLYGVLWVWGLAAVLRIQYYSHWRISESLNNAAGFGYWDNAPGDSPDWSRLCDGDFWTIEALSRMSEFARRWNTTTALWLRRLVYIRCKRFPLFMTFSFSVLWHGCHLGHFVGFLTWAATVKADYHIHRHLCPKPSSTWRKIYTCLSWINTQMIVACIVIAVELRNKSGLRLLSITYIGLFPLFNIILPFILLKFNTI
ncbi:membrane-bound ghrelin O-acyltransferase mboat4 [Perca flavescens]|uniref:membrane-bound ghrelin O-acyltransferase mboat4 n=1 Tax=Perca flavescens TaxID=8167 RepID=UPI00106E259E|nr:ghrelin O-acyltransferase [Perca flavescens]